MRFLLLVVLLSLAEAKEKRKSYQKIVESKKVSPKVSMSFSRQELFDKSNFQIKNAYVRIYQAIGEAIRSSHHFNLVDNENQKALSKMAHVVEHVAKQRDDRKDYLFKQAIQSKIDDANRNLGLAEKVSSEVETFCERVRNQINNLVDQIKIAKEKKGSDHLYYITMFVTQIVLMYYLYVIIFKRKLVF